MKFSPSVYDAAGARLVATTAKILAAATFLALPAMAQADDQDAVQVDTGYDNIVVTEQVSAHRAKRLARGFLTERGFSSGMGPGAARIRSITREGDTWVVQIALNNNNRHVMNEKHYLYIDADTAVVSETPPSSMTERVASN
ncbi:MAG: hypothetical protein OEW35_02625 [Gammaproteobacteria bacterium]|nr:hypothetical protein [Gammaproteobacteria bacterium]MDH4257077.1 hypothetical protein [Gammaproteobacteria bacterium]MDH5309446.1 hypothetical protein [Gammaproteobacteria bacterium]